MIKTTMLALALAGGLATAALAQEATGDWTGKVTIPEGALTVTAHITAGPNGLEGVAGSPDQTDMPLPMADVAVKDGTLSFSVPVVRASYTGKWDAAAGGWVGALSQNGVDMPLTFKRRP